MPKMDADLKAKWVQALRSGKYAQSRGMLRGQSGGYCCLGVLADVAGLELSNCGNFVAGYKDYAPIALLLGATKPDGEESIHKSSLWIGDVCGRFTTMNDNEDKSFAEIADYAEANC